MKKNKHHLERIRHIGSARRNQLKKIGITDIRLLYHVPTETLAGIKFFGKKSAARIKKEVADYVANELPPIPEKKRRENGDKLSRSFKKLSKWINRTDEKLRPLWNKKYQIPYIEFKKSIVKLNRHVAAVEEKGTNLSRKQKTRIVKKTRSFYRHLKDQGARPKKKEYKAITAEIKAFSKFLKTYNS